MSKGTSFTKVQTLDPISKARKGWCRSASSVSSRSVHVASIRASPVRSQPPRRAGDRRSGDGAALLSASGFSHAHRLTGTRGLKGTRGLTGSALCLSRAAAGPLSSHEVNEPTIRRSLLS